MLKRPAETVELPYYYAIYLPLPQRVHHFIKLRPAILRAAGIIDILPDNLKPSGLAILTQWT
jgi:hypothetical protein